MKLRDLFFIICLCLACGLAANADQQQMQIEQAEAQGVEIGQPSGAPPASANHLGRPSLGMADFLLIPDSTADRIMAFDPVTGDLLDADFIPADPTNMSTPIHAILSAGGDSILISDQTKDVVLEYGLDGAFIGIFAPAGGANTTILDNIRGISLRANGNLLVTVGGGTNENAVAEFDTSGTYLGNFVANGAGGLDSPFDVLLGTDALVCGIDSDALYSYDLNTGAYSATVAPVDTFPEQIAFAGNGNILIANFSGTQAGVMELLPDGTVVGIYSPESGVRGAYELPNGNILTTNGSGVYEINRSGVLVETKATGVSARFIELISGAVPVVLQRMSLE